MKRFMLLHFGFEKPTPQIMEAWNEWFAATADRTVDKGGFHGAASEISGNGKRELPMSADSITGYSIITAEDMDEAERIARENPFIASIRVYEII